MVHDSSCEQSLQGRISKFIFPLVAPPSSKPVVEEYLMTWYTRAGTETSAVARLLSLEESVCNSAFRCALKLTVLGSHPDSATVLPRASYLTSLSQVYSL